MPARLSYGDAQGGGLGDIFGGYKDRSILLVSKHFFSSSTKGDSEILDRRVTRYIMLYNVYL